jgi:hypothetical protein
LGSTHDEVRGGIPAVSTQQFLPEDRLQQRPAQRGPAGGLDRDDQVTGRIVEEPRQAGDLPTQLDRPALFRTHQPIQTRRGQPSDAGRLIPIRARNERGDDREEGEDSDGPNETGARP